MKVERHRIFKVGYIDSSGSQVALVNAPNAIVAEDTLKREMGDGINVTEVIEGRYIGRNRQVVWVGGGSGGGGGIPINVPTKLSQLANDTGFITSTADNLQNYYKKAEVYNKTEVYQKNDTYSKSEVYAKNETYTKEEVDAKMNAIEGLKKKIMTALPSTGEDNTLYFVPSSDPQAQNRMDEFFWVNNAWEKIGTIAFEVAQSDWDETDSSSRAFIRNKPEIPVMPIVPTNVSELNNDAGYLTEHQDLSDYAKKEDVPAAYDDTALQERVKALENSEGSKSLDMKADAEYYVPGYMEGGGIDRHFFLTLEEGVDYPSSYNAFVDGQYYGIMSSSDMNLPIVVKFQDGKFVDDNGDWIMSVGYTDGNYNMVLSEDWRAYGTEWGFAHTGRRLMPGQFDAANTQVRADWNEGDPSKASYIRNKPAIKEVPELTASGYWKFRVYSDGMFEAFYSASGQSVTINVSSGNLYRSSLLTLTLPAELTNNGTVNISHAIVNVSHNNYPTWGMLASLRGASINYYGMSGDSRGLSPNHLITAHVVGEVGD